MTHDRRYTSPAAFRRALTDRLNAAAKSTPWTPQQLQRQVAYDRLLERLYLLDDHWIVKGATALLARNLGVRGTLDIDLYRQTTRDAAEADVWQAARADLGDWFTFEIGTGTPISNDATRLPVNALIGATTWIRFHLDLVGTAVQMTGQPEDVPPLARGLMPDVTQRGYRAYPLVDHIADKVAANYERYGTSRMPSTRYRDLVDLVAIITGASMDASAQRTALESKFTRRSGHTPTRCYKGPPSASSTHLTGSGLSLDHPLQPSYRSPTRRGLVASSDVPVRDAERLVMAPWRARWVQCRNHRRWQHIAAGTAGWSVPVRAGGRGRRCACRACA
jgi:hypothetical protein